ncbi:MAG: DNA repair protein RecO [Deltaproteobacteria bacterium]|nr:DNA repair protein RecO [Deltaproteobacteria bacterium]
MPIISTPAILLRRMDYADFDVITTFFTLKQGKLALIAKSAKKSTKRFAGILELFSVLEVVAATGRGKGLPVLQEAALKQPFGAIRADFRKTAYASYWCELICNWIEENFKQAALYYLLKYVLTELDSGRTEDAGLHILFQMRFLTLSGHRPNLAHCSLCQTKIEAISQDTIDTDLKRGGILCGNCTAGYRSRVALAKGTLKQLLWVESGNLAKAARIKFTKSALDEGAEFLEEFISYHLGKQPRSLSFLRQIRNSDLRD